MSHLVKITSAFFKNGSALLLGSDMVGEEGIIKGSNITLSLDCSSEEEIHTFFSRLSSGGNITYPVSVEFWGGLYGTLTDKFGYSWMLTYDKTTQE